MLINRKNDRLRNRLKGRLIPEKVSFLPLDVPGLLVWLKSDVGLYQDSSKTTAAESGDDPVRVWEDQSGNGNDAEASADNKRPLLKLAVQNGMNAPLWDGANDCLVTPSLSYGAFTIFMVFATASADVSFNLYERSISTTVSGEFLNCSGIGEIQIKTIRSSTGTTYVEGDVINDQSWFISTHSYNGNNADHLLRLDGSPVTFDSNPLADDPGIAVIGDTMNIGARQDGISKSGNIYIGEYIIYNSVLSTDNITLVETYLNNKWAAF